MLAVVRISRQYFFWFQYGFEDTPLLTESTGELFRDFKTTRPTQTQKIGTRGGTQRGTRCRDTLAEWRNINKLREPP